MENHNKIILELITKSAKNEERALKLRSNVKTAEIKIVASLVLSHFKVHGIRKCVAIHVFFGEVQWDMNLRPFHNHYTVRSA